MTRLLARAWAGEPVHSFDEFGFIIVVWMLTKKAWFGTGSHQASLSLEFLDTGPAMSTDVVEP